VKSLNGGRDFRKAKTGGSPVLAFRVNRGFGVVHIYNVDL
jgi:hypothetical protein